MSWVRRGCCAFVTSAMLQGLASAQAQVTVFNELGDALRIEAGATCLVPDKLVQHVATWLGTTQIDSQLSVTVYGHPQSPHVVWFGIERAGVRLSERRFEPGPEGCEDMHAALGLAIALGIKASLLESFVPRLGYPHARRVTATPRWAMEIDLLGSHSVVPGVAFGAGLRVQRILVGSVMARLGLVGLTGPDRAFTHGSGQFDIWLFSGHLDACNAFRLTQRLQLSACLGLALGRYYVRGQALSPSRSGQARFVAFANVLDFVFELNAMRSIHAAITALFPLDRTRIVVLDGAGPVPDMTGPVVETNDLARTGGFLSMGPTLRF